MKLIIASLVIFSLVILFLFALFPSDISVTRVVQINRPKTAVRKKIADLREWKSWNRFLYDAFAQNLPNNVTGMEDSGHITRPSVSVELLKAGPDTVITRWHHEKKSFDGDFIMTEMNGQVVLEWTLHFHLKWYPWDKLAGMFYDKQLGPAMEQSLMNLRQELESAPY